MGSSTLTMSETKVEANPGEKVVCPRCKMSNAADVEFCAHCGARLGPHRHVPWWHVHRRVYDWTLAWAYRPSAAWALFVLSFAESSFFPVPPDVLLMPLVLGNRKKWLRYATICSVASVVGGVAGYLIGIGLWNAISPYAFQWFAWAGLNQDNFDKAYRWYENWNFGVVFLAGFTPLPFKVITITAGVFKINFLIFLVAATISRSARFFLVAGLCRKFGPRITPFIDKYFNWLALLFAALLIGGFVVFKYVL